MFQAKITSRVLLSLGVLVIGFTGSKAAARQSARERAIARLQQNGEINRLMRGGGYMPLGTDADGTTREAVLAHVYRGGMPTTQWRTASQEGAPDTYDGERHPEPVRLDNGQPLIKKGFLENRDVVFMRRVVSEETGGGGGDVFKLTIHSRKWRPWMNRYTFKVSAVQVGEEHPNVRNQTVRCEDRPIPQGRGGFLFWTAAGAGEHSVSRWYTNSSAFNHRLAGGSADGNVTTFVRVLENDWTKPHSTEDLMELPPVPAGMYMYDGNYQEFRNNEC